MMNIGRFAIMFDVLDTRGEAVSAAGWEGPIYFRSTPTSATILVLEGKIARRD
jgi:hypothetical protein